jgi:signal transduction histidine kinase/CBS domain-containing protein
MKHRPVTVKPGDTAWHALGVMVEHSIRRVPVLEGEGLAGMVTERDIRTAMLSILSEPIGAPASNGPSPGFLEMPVTEVMTREVVRVTPDTDLTTAVTLMIEKNIGGLPVVDEHDRLIGMLTRSDVFQLVIDGEKSAKRNRWLEITLHALEAASASLDVNEAFRAVAELIRPILPHDRASILLLEDEDRSFSVYALLSDAQKPAIPDVRAPLHQGDIVPVAGTMSGDVVMRRQYRIIADIDKETEPFPETTVFSRLGMRSALAVPMMLKGKPIGAFNLYSRQPGAFTEEGADLLQHVANAIAAALHNADLYRQQEEHNQQLREAGRIKDELLAMISHDLRSPLTAVLAYTRIMNAERRGPLPEAYREIINELESSGKYMVGLLDDLMDVARLGFGGLQLDSAEFDLVSLAREVTESVRGETDEKSISLSFHEPSDREIVVNADAKRVRQILMNLLTNAVKFNRPHGTIDVRLRPNEREVEVEVADSGPGIAPENQQAIFDMFRRLDSHKTIAGSGLGLTITRELVELHGGRIWVESQLGEGARFIFTLPRSVTREAPPPAAPPVAHYAKPG